MKFNVEGLQRNQRVDDMSFGTFIEWLTTEQGKYKMAVYVGWGGTFAIALGIVKKHACLMKNYERLMKNYASLMKNHASLMRYYASLMKTQ